VVSLEEEKEKEHLKRVLEEMLGWEVHDEKHNALAQMNLSSFFFFFAWWIEMRN
jgi:hypothetical protein